MPRVRVHQHVNPLSPYYRQAPKPVEIATVFVDPSNSLLLDIGSARGRFLFRMAEADPTWNYLGVEIRAPLVAEANRLAEEAGLSNLHYEFCNAMIWLERLLADVPSGVLQKVTIQFPDPWFKKKHAKRRMVTPDLVDIVVNRLAAGGDIFIQTDIEFLADEMFGLFLRSDGLVQRNLDSNPFPVKTERETAVEQKGLQIYRAVFTKT